VASPSFPAPGLTLTLDDARLMTLRAQGLIGTEGRRGGVPGMLRRIGAVQLDTISVLARSHELVAYARLGPVPRDRIERAYWHPRRPAAFEYWSHAACVLPIEEWPYYAFRRRALRARGKRWHQSHRGTCDEVLARLQAEGSDAHGAQSHHLRGESLDEAFSAALEQFHVGFDLDHAGPPRRQHVIYHEGHAGVRLDVRPLAALGNAASTDVYGVGLRIVAEAYRHHVGVASRVDCRQAAQALKDDGATRVVACAPPQSEAPPKNVKYTPGVVLADVEEVTLAHLVRFAQDSLQEVRYPADLEGITISPECRYANWLRGMFHAPDA
jgi:hypothetical protein